MDNKQKRRFVFVLITLVFTIAITAIHFRVALAAVQCHQPFLFAGELVQSCKDNKTSSPITYWNGRMISDVYDATLYKVGWDIWTDTYYCNGEPLKNYDNGVSLGTNVGYWASTSTHPILSCNGPNKT